MFPKKLTFTNLLVNRNVSNGLGKGKCTINTSPSLCPCLLAKIRYIFMKFGGFQHLIHQNFSR